MPARKKPKRRPATSQKRNAYMRLMSAASDIMRAHDFPFAWLMRLAIVAFMGLSATNDTAGQFRFTGNTLAGLQKQVNETQQGVRELKQFLDELRTKPKGDRP